MSTIAVIGSGFSGLTCSIALAAEGHQVSVYEKNETIGGRARVFEKSGFKFDMGPSWYWMPDVFESFFRKYGFEQKNLYKLERLDPSYRVFFEHEQVDIPADYQELEDLFESIEKGSAIQLRKFLKEAKVKYQVGMEDLVFKPGKSVFEYFDFRVLKGVFSLHLFTSISEYIRSHFTDPKLIQLLEFPVLFLGAMPKDTPALYSLMNYADIKLGTWYPAGGMFEVIKAMEKVAEHHGVKFFTDHEITKFDVQDNRIKKAFTSTSSIEADAYVASADYHHIEQQVLPPAYRQYSEDYWDSRKMSPSSVLFYLGVNKRLEGLLHHNLFFDESFDAHASDIYEDPAWPKKPLFYVCCPSRTDKTVAPEGSENLFILIPVAAGLKDSEELMDHYYDLVMSRLEKRLKTEIAAHVVYKKSYSHKNFSKDYNAYKGNAYGLANTLAQTAIFKPRMHHKKIKNLIYTGQLTVPGPGVPPSIVSGQVAAAQIMKKL